MKKVITTIFLICTSIFAIAEMPDVESGSSPAEKQNTYVLIVSGINRDPNERLAKVKAVTKLRKFFLEQAKVKSNRLSVLVDDRSSVRKECKKSTAENLKETLNKLSAAVRPTDRFIFYYVGQANVVVETLRLNLPGKDMTHKQLAELLNKVKVSSMLLVLDCPGAGLTAKAMKRQGRIAIYASKSDQRYSTRFSEYFVPALVDIKSDTDGDAKVSLLEAFTLASRQLDDWYSEQRLLKTETPLLEDNADGVPSQQPWRYKQGKRDGLAASKFFF